MVKLDCCSERQLIKITDRVSVLQRSRANSFTPVGKLPNELLQIIFKIAYGLAGRGSFPRRVSHVMHRWRYAVLDMPFLWTDIRIGWGFPKAEGLLIRYLEKSQKCSLQVTFNLAVCGRTMSYETTSRYDNLIRLVVRHVDRWQRLYVRAPSSYGNHWHALQHCHAPRLEFCDIELVPFDSTPYHLHRNVKLFTRGAPILSSMIVQGLENVYLPLDNVERLQLGPTRGREQVLYSFVVSTIDAMPSLTHLVFHKNFVLFVPSRRVMPLVIASSLLSLELSLSRVTGHKIPAKPLGGTSAGVSPGRCPRDDGCPIGCGVIPRGPAWLSLSSLEIGQTASP